ncbi:MAG: hypothetical protein L6R28_10485 [Planctomycetes bacterium]|nr:hypothetical protein [Planctomycetota bacterium]
MEPNQESSAPRQSIWPRVAAIAAGLAFLVVVAKLLAPFAVPNRYKPETFRQGIVNFIVAERYDHAVRLLGAADIEAQVTYDLAATAPSYMVIQEDGQTIPGIDALPTPQDWVVPGTSDVLYDETWQRAVTDFAERYNLALKARLDKAMPAKP